MSLNQIFYPQSVAIIGASDKKHSVGCDILKNLTTQGFSGEVFAVNPKHESILGKKSYSNVASLPKKPDLVIIAVPGKIVPSVFHELAVAQIQAVIVVSAGFKEFSEEGKLMEEQIAEICEKNKISLVGVNCLGVLNTDNNLNASFASHLPAKGKVGFIAQSGALCTSVIDKSSELGMGFSKIISIGNKTMVDETDLIEYLQNDVQTEVIMVYVEDVKNPTKMLENSTKITKPVIVLKAGRSKSGSIAAQSHTGAISGSDDFYKSLFRQCGFIQVDTIEEMFSVSIILSSNSLPLGPNVAVVTNAGGPATITSDSLEIHGLKLASLTPQTQEELKNVLPVGSNYRNPVDLLGDSDALRYSAALEKVLKDPGVDSCIVILTPQSNTQILETANVILNSKKLTGKPLVVSFMGGDKVKEAIKLLSSNHIATIPYPDHAASSLALISQNVENKKIASTQTIDLNITAIQKAHTHKLLETTKKQGMTHLPEVFAKEILESYGFPVLQGHLVNSELEAEELLTQIGTKCVLKVVSQDILHKSDVGGVILNVDSYNCRHSYAKLLENVKAKAPNAKIEGVMVTEMANLDDGFEFFLGVKTEPGLGKMIVFGLGGIFVELIADVTFGVTPIDESEATKMVERLKSSKAFGGIRGKKKLDKAKIVETIVRLSNFLNDFPQIQEIDLNPVLALPNTCKILDSRMVISDE